MTHHDNFIEEKILVEILFIYRTDNAYDNRSMLTKTTMFLSSLSFSFTSTISTSQYYSESVPPPKLFKLLDVERSHLNTVNLSQRNSSSKLRPSKNMFLLSYNALNVFGLIS